MSYSETHTLTFAKPALRALQPKVIESNTTSLLASIGTKSLTVRGWTFERNLCAVDEDEMPVFYRQGDNPRADGYVYELWITATFERADNKKPTPNEFASIARTIYGRAIQPQFGKWTLDEVDGETYRVPDDDSGVSSNVNADLIGYADVIVPDDWDSHFEHLFGVTSHIKRIKGAIEAGIMSEWANRFHCVLIGPPGCGKSDTAANIKRALGDDAVMEYDATATTAAGAIKDLSERDILPRVLIVEEIEKADPNTLGYLLALLDLRGEIRKTTARGRIQRDTKLLVVATVNNFDLFTKMQAGALASRFANQIWYRRPSREQLAMILTREVAKIDGDERWIKPTLDYCDEHGITDPRQVIALCLCGRDELITGEYQTMLAETAPETSGN